MLWLELQHHGCAADSVALGRPHSDICEDLSLQARDPSLGKTRIDMLFGGLSNPLAVMTDRRDDEFHRQE